MSDDQRAERLSPEDRHRLKRDALRAVRLLSESLEQADEAPDADGAALLARVHAAIEPLRATTARFSGEGSLNVGGQAALVSSARFGGGGSLRVGVVHVLRPDSATHTQTAGEVAIEHVEVQASDTLVVNLKEDAAVGFATGALTWTGTAEGSSPEAFQVTADDVPWILWQMLLRFDDMANPTNSGPTFGQVYDRLMPLLGLIIALLPYLV